MQISDKEWHQLLTGIKELSQRVEYLEDWIQTVPDFESLKSSVNKCLNMSAGVVYRMNRQKIYEITNSLIYKNQFSLQDKVDAESSL